jgi:hypothetical protein
MDRADEVTYSAGLPGVPRMILWVKFSPRGGVLNPPLVNKEDLIRDILEILDRGTGIIRGNLLDLLR